MEPETGVGRGIRTRGGPGGGRDVDVEKESGNGRFGLPRAFRRGEMARFSYRTDIRPVQEPRTKSYIHASSHYASLSRLGSAVRRERRRTEKERPATRMIRARERTTENAVGLSGWFFSRMRGGESSCVPDSQGYDGFRGEGKGGGETVRLYFIHGGAVVARIAGKKSEGEP